MSMTEDAERVREYKRKVKALGPEPKAEAERVKAWFAAHPEKPVRWGLAYSCTPTERLDLDLVRSELGPKKVAKCMVPGKRETLSVVEKPAAAKPKKAAAKKPPTSG